MGSQPSVVARGSEEAVCQQVEQIEAEGDSGAENAVTAPTATGFNAFAVHRALWRKQYAYGLSIIEEMGKILSQLDGHSQFYVKEKECIRK